MFHYKYKLLLVLHGEVIERKEYKTLASLQARYKLYRRYFRELDFVLSVSCVEGCTYVGMVHSISRWSVVRFLELVKKNQLFTSGTRLVF